MLAGDVRYLFAYDRWATRRILAALDGSDEATRGAVGVVGDRGLGSILVHQLGAHQRWRHSLSESPEVPRHEREPLPSPAGLAAAWDAEWVATDALLDAITDEWLAQTDRDVPFWQMLAHVANHGTQHRSEAAAILTTAGPSPGDLDMIFFAEEQARPAG